MNNNQGNPLTKLVYVLTLPAMEFVGVLVKVDLKLSQSDDEARIPTYPGDRTQNVT